MNSISKILNLDTIQTLTRAFLKIGGGFLLAKGISDEDTTEALPASGVALAAVIWGIAHRTPKRNAQPTVAVPLPLLLWLFLLFPMAAGLPGCASPNALAFRAEQAATDAAYAELFSWKAYYTCALTNTPPEKIGVLEDQNERIYAASRSFAAVMLTVDQLREQCLTNAAARPALEISLDAAQAEASNLVWMVRSAFRTGQKF